MKEKIKNFFKNVSVYQVVFFLLLALYALSFAVVMLWGLISTFKDGNIDGYNIGGLPSKWVLSNYIELFDKMAVKTFVEGETVRVNLPSLCLNSLVYCVGSTVLATLSPCCMAYICAKYKFKASGIISTTVVVVMLIPSVGTLPSAMMVTRALGVYDKMWGMFILKAGFTNMYFLVFYSTFKSLSWEYAESAFIDGATHFKVMVQIMLPLVKPIILSVGLIFFIQFWNDYQTLLVYMPNTPTLAYAIYAMRQLGGNAIDGVNAGDTFLQLTGSFIVVVPIFILFMAFKDKLMNNVTMGGLKG